MPEVHKSISAAQRKKDPHAGVGDSFPEDRAHIKAAFDLAGHAPNADEVRHNVIAFARAHNMMNLLPETAHNFMHEHGVQHKHDNMANDKDGMHSHVVAKAFNPEALGIVVSKSWLSDDGLTAYYEGFVSPGHRKDSEKDLVRPEAFLPAVDGYMLAGGPVSSEHDTHRYPIGHTQKIALIRDGKIFKAAEHPTDPAEFTQLDEWMEKTGVRTGAYLRGAITEDPARSAVQKGNVRGLSWIGNVSKYIPLPDGGREFTEINELWETTVAAYPIHKDAVLTIAKAYTSEPESQEETPEVDFNDFMQQFTEWQKNHQPESAPAAPPADVQAQKAFTAEDVAKAVQQALEAQASNFEAKLEEKVQKALTLRRGDPVDSKQTVDPRQAFSDDPIAFLAQKAATVKDVDEWTAEEKAVIWAATDALLRDSMND